MKLHYLVALVIFNLLLFGIVTSTHSQTNRHELFGSGSGLSTPLFGSCGRECLCQCESRCEWEPESSPADACEQGCVAACVSMQKPGSSRMAQKSVAQKIALQKSVVQKSVAQKSVVQKDAGYCDSDCRPKPVARAFAKLDDAVKGLFRPKSGCCDPCCDSCNTVTSCNAAGGKSDCCCDSAYGEDSEAFGSPIERGSPSQYDGLEEPLLDRNPFEDDAVQPPPLMPFEVRVTPRPGPLPGLVAAVEVSSPFRLQAPPRLRPVDATPLRKTPLLARSIMDRGRSAATRRDGDLQPSYRLASGQSELASRSRFVTTEN